MGTFGRVGVWTRARVGGRVDVAMWWRGDVWVSARAKRDGGVATWTWACGRGHLWHDVPDAAAHLQQRNVQASDVDLESGIGHIPDLASLVPAANPALLRLEEIQVAVRLQADRVRHLDRELNVKLARGEASREAIALKLRVVVDTSIAAGVLMDLGLDNIKKFLRTSRWEFLGS